MNTTVNKNEEDSKLVQMRLQPKTLDRVQHLTSLMGTQNRTQIVSASLQIAESLLKDVKDGSKIYVERPDGTRELLMFVGI
jgi:hypothetical protein